MRQDADRRAVRMRAVAARLRNQALETGIGIYRRRFEMVASELEEAATDLESRAHAVPRDPLMPREKGSGRGYSH